jgi:hypothetical protein
MLRKITLALVAAARVPTPFGYRLRTVNVCD